MKRVEEAEAEGALVVGEEYLVPCAKIVSSINKEPTLVPVINHPHSDRENGQPEVHYHIDDRFVGEAPDGFKLEVVEGFAVRVTEFEMEYLTHVRMTCAKVSVGEDTITPVEYIRNSKLKHSCMRNGKCPHRGYDLSKATPDADGVVTCPLHGLRFKEGKLIDAK